jgi:post-segregation antitoxin (ccd killing protein)
VRPPSHNVKAPKQTVSLTINSDLYAQAKTFGINASQVAEEALAEEVARGKAEALRSEIRQDLDACDAYAAQHGTFADMVRDHYRRGDEET